MGFSITSTVERVLAITELVDLICELSPRYGTTEWSIYSSYDNSSPGLSSYGALPVLARTTRFLSRRALRVLWRRLDSFWPLLRLLPDDLLDVGESPSYLGEQAREEYEVCLCPMPLLLATHASPSATSYTATRGLPSLRILRTIRAIHIMCSRGIPSSAHF